MDSTGWTPLQRRVLCLVALAIILDGFDIQVLGFALPAIIGDWGGDRSAFGPVFAVGFVGMALGTIAGGWLGDRFGRRSGMFASGIAFGIFTGATALVETIEQLAVMRFLASVGLGAMMPSATSLVAEFAPARNRAMAVTVTIVCVPIGGVLGGFLAGELLPEIGWRALFAVGGLLPILVVVLLYFSLPESPRFLLRTGRCPEKLRRTLRALGARIPENSIIVDTAEQSDALPASFVELVRPMFLRDTVGLWIGFFSGMLTIYLTFSWAPTLLSTAGFTLDRSSYGLMLFNVGGVAGALAAAWAVGHLGSRSVMVAVSLIGSLMASLVSLVSFVPENWVLVAVGLTALGTFANAAQVGLFALAANVYPVQIRSTGVGATVGVGRLGAIAASLIGAWLISGGSTRFFLVLSASLAVTAIGFAAVTRHVRHFSVGRPIDAPDGATASP